MTKYIGTAGDLNRKKGVDLLINAFMEIAEGNSKLNLVLAGPKEKRLNIPAKENIRYLGQLDHEKVPLLFSALDAGVICVKDDNFGRYCFPQKYYEMVACDLPLVASNVGEMSRLLAETTSLLFKPDNLKDMERAIEYQLQHKLTLSVEVPTWEKQAIKFDRIIKEVGNR